MDRNQSLALEFWTAQSLPERKAILAALEADESLVSHDFSALPPQVRAGITAGLHPVGEATEASAEESGGDPEDHGRRKRKRSDD